VSAPAKAARKPRRKKATPAELRAALKDQPLVGLVEAARILGVKPPNITRLREQGRMPAGVQVEGAAMVYVRSEVEALAKALARERSKR
jgi:predicted DNA-binding transcriptional regulator AlpA